MSQSVSLTETTQSDVSSEASFKLFDDLNGTNSGYSPELSFPCPLLKPGESLAEYKERFKKWHNDKRAAERKAQKIRKQQKLKEKKANGGSKTPRIARRRRSSLTLPTPASRTKPAPQRGKSNVRSRVRKSKSNKILRVRSESPAIRKKDFKKISSKSTLKSGSSKSSKKTKRSSKKVKSKSRAATLSAGRKVSAATPPLHNRQPVGLANGGSKTNLVAKARAAKAKNLIRQSNSSTPIQKLRSPRSARRPKTARQYGSLPMKAPQKTPNSARRSRTPRGRRSHKRHASTQEREQGWSTVF